MNLLGICTLVLGIWAPVEDAMTPGMAGLPHETRAHAASSFLFGENYGRIWVGVDDTWIIGDATLSHGTAVLVL